MSAKKKPIQQLTDPAFITSVDETARLRKDMYRSDIEKFRLFTQMLRTNNLIRRTKIVHK